MRDTSSVNVQKLAIELIRRCVQDVWLVVYDRLPATSNPPSGWRIIQEGVDGRAWRYLSQRFTVIESVSRESDGLRWHHVSCARSDRMPTWDEIKLVKSNFVGDIEAYIVMPPQAQYVNIHEYCIHLWACLDVKHGKILPDFTAGTGSL